MGNAAEDNHKPGAPTPSDPQAVAEATALHGSVTVTPLRNGPLMLRGPLEIVLGEAAARETEAFLCRCGASAKKPFCDGTHKKIGFTAEGGRRR
jgi:CDGSH-type Zn-finger protein